MHASEMSSSTNSSVSEPDSYFKFQENQNKFIANSDTRGKKVAAVLCNLTQRRWDS